MKSQFLLKLAQKIQLTCRLPRSVSFGEKVDALLAGSSATSITDEQYISGESFSSKSLHDNSIRRNIILVASVNLPLFDQNSGALRLKNLIRLMSEAGWTIVFGSVYKRSKQPGLVSRRKGRKFYEDALRADGVSHFLYGMAEIESFLVQAGKELDWAFLSFPTIAARLISRVRSHCATARIAFDMVDFHALRLMREAALHNDHELQIEAERQREEELACVKSADVTFAVTQEEKALLSELVPEAVVEVLPNVFDIPRRTYVGPAGRKGILFVGGFLHKPNVDAICWFMDRIWPMILREEHDIVLGGGQMQLQGRELYITIRLQYMQNNKFWLTISIPTGKFVAIYKFQLLKAHGLHFG
ncbi:MAG: hypothetical protein HGA46_09615, partial [Chlorobiaceae bacterium]|nr:hypothetical protein [Chlorobiaceae bacterium]